MRLSKIVGFAMILTTVSGCQAASPADDRPARITDPTEASRAALLNVVTASLNGADVTLAQDALTHTSLLVIDHKTYRDAEHNPIMGRNVNTPTQFHLVKNGVQCLLTQPSRGTRWLLADTTCEYE